MKYNYGPITKSAQGLIRRFGGPASIVATSKVSNAEPWKPGTKSSQKLDITAVFLNYEQKYIDGTVIQYGDQKVLFSAADATIPVNLTGWIERGSEKWNIVKIEPLNPGGTIVIYTVQVRQ